MRRGHRELCRCDTGSDSIHTFALMGESLGRGTLQEAVLFLLGAGWACLSLPSLLQRVEATLVLGQSREAQERKGPGLHFPVNKLLKIEPVLA